MNAVLVANPVKSFTGVVWEGTGDRPRNHFNKWVIVGIATDGEAMGRGQQRGREDY